MLNFGPGNSLTHNLHKCPGEKLTQSLHSAFFNLCLQFDDSSHYLKTLDSMHNRAEVEIKERAKRKHKNFTFTAISRNESIDPKEQHKEGGSSPNRDSDIDNKLQHS